MRKKNVFKRGGGREREREREGEREKERECCPLEDGTGPRVNRLSRRSFKTLVNYTARQLMNCFWGDW